MPSCLRSLVWTCLASVLAWSLLPGLAGAQIVLAGLDVTFTKIDDTDPAMAQNQDRLTPQVWITRGFGGGVYNAFAEAAFPVRDETAISPKYTEWATIVNNPTGPAISAENWATLDFDTWLNAYGGLHGGGPNTVGKDAVVHIHVDGESSVNDIYLDLKFTDWSVGGSGGFSYMRSRIPSGDYNGNGVVDAADYVVWRKTLNQSVTKGTGADGNASGMIDQGDYDYWQARFGSLVAAAGGGATGDLAPATVPEPVSGVLVLGGLLFNMLLKRYSPRGPLRIRSNHEG